MLFPVVPFIPLAMKGAQKWQIKAISICPEWIGEIVWLWLVMLRTKMAPICLSMAAECLRFSCGSKEEPPERDPLDLWIVTVG